MFAKPLWGRYSALHFAKINKREAEVTEKEEKKL